MDEYDEYGEGKGISQRLRYKDQSKLVEFRTIGEGVLSVEQLQLLFPRFANVISLGLEGPPGLIKVFLQYHSLPHPKLQLKYCPSREDDIEFCATLTIFGTADDVKKFEDDNLKSTIMLKLREISHALNSKEFENISFDLDDMDGLEKIISEDFKEKEMSKKAPILKNKDDK